MLHDNLEPRYSKAKCQTELIWAQMTRGNLSRERNLHWHVRINMSAIVNTAYGRFTNVNYY